MRVGDRSRIRSWCARGIVAVLAVSAQGVSLASLQPTAEARAGIVLLHQGRFDAASAAFRSLSLLSPEDPEGPIMEALTTWWRLVDNPKDPALLRTLDESLQETVRRGEVMIEGRDPQRGRILAGTALVLTAQTRALAGKYFAAGTAAREGHGYLEKALADDPQAADAGFALGAYKYYAAKLPWLVRALRVFIRIPGGDTKEGLENLQSAAERGLFFRSEALVLLAYIHSSDEEGDPRKSIEYIEAARAADGDSPLLAAVEARLQFALGRLGASERMAREAIGLSAPPPHVAEQIPALARLYLSLSLYYQYRPREALAELRPLIAGDDGPLGEASATAHGLYERLIRELPAAADPPAATVPAGDAVAAPRMVSSAPIPFGAEAAIENLRDGNVEEAVAELASAVSRSPEDLVARYHLARAYQAARRREEGVSELRRVVADGASVPRTLKGWALIRIGEEMDAGGHRDEAETWFRRAASLKGFIFAKAAGDRLKHPADPVPTEG